MKNAQYRDLFLIDLVDDLVVAERRAADLEPPFRPDAIGLGSLGDAGAVVQEFIDKAGGAWRIVLADKSGDCQQVVSGFGFEPKN